MTKFADYSLFGKSIKGLINFLEKAEIDVYDDDPETNKRRNVSKVPRTPIRVVYKQPAFDDEGGEELEVIHKAYCTVRLPDNVDPPKSTKAVKVEPYDYKSDLPGFGPPQ